MSVSLTCDFNLFIEGSELFYLAVCYKGLQKIFLVLYRRQLDKANLFLLRVLKLFARLRLPILAICILDLQQQQN